MVRTATEELLHCSFCGKGQDKIAKLIAGPGVYICDECVELCNHILAEELSRPELREAVTRRAAAKPRSTDEQASA